MRQYHQAVILRRSIDHLTSSRGSWSNGINGIKFTTNGLRISLWISWFIRIEPHGQVSCGQLQVISISLNISSCGAALELSSPELTVTSFFAIHDASSAQRISSGIGQPSL